MEKVMLCLPDPTQVCRDNIPLHSPENKYAHIYGQKTNPNKVISKCFSNKS